MPDSENIKGEDQPPKAPKARRTRRWLVLLFLAVLATGGWFAVERYVLDVNRYRSFLVDEIELATGLPASIGRLDLVLFPYPHLNGYDVSVGDGDFLAHAETVYFETELRPLLDSHLNITQISLGGLRLVLPQDPNDIQARVDNLIEKLTEPIEGEPLVTSDVREVTTTDAEVWLHGHTAPFLRLTGSGRDILSDEVSITLDGNLLQYGPQADANATLTLALTDGAITAINGGGTVSEMDLATLPYDWAPEATLNGSFYVEGTNFSYVSVTTNGDMVARDNDALTCDYAAEIWWDHGDLVVNDVDWLADGLEFEADATYFADNRLAIKISTLAVSGESLKYVLDQVDQEDIRLVAAEDAVLNGEYLLVARAPEGAYTWVEGALSITGVDIGEADTDTMITRQARGTFETIDGTIHIRELAGEGFAFTGDFTPDFDADRHSFDIAGNVDLATAPLGNIVTNDVRDVRGRLSFERIAGTFDDWPEVPENLVVQGAIQDGAFRFASEAYEDAFSSVDARFTTGADGIDSQISTTSEKLGPVALNGRYSFPERTWNGTGTVNVPRVVETFVPSEEQRARFQTAISRYGDSTLDITVALATEERPEMSIGAERQGDPPFTATADFAETDSGFSMRDLHAATRLPLADFAIDFPSSVSAEGLMNVSFHRDAAARRFSVLADATDTTIVAGNLLEKRPGTGLRVDLAGPATEELWHIEHVTVSCLDESLAFMMEDDRAIAQDFEIALASLAPLFKNEATAGGTIRGTLATTPTELDITLIDAGIQMSDVLTIESLNGEVAFRDGYPVMRNLVVKGANSDCTINAGRNGEEWSGSLSGQKFDADAFLRLLEELNAFLTENEENALPAVVTVEELPIAGPDVVPAEEESVVAVDVAVSVENASEPFQGWFDIALDELYYRRGKLEALRAQAQIDGDGIHIRDLTCRPYTGQLSGNVHLVSPGSGKGDIDVDLNFDGIDLRIVDDMLLAEPRGLVGTMSGRFVASAPMQTPREAVQKATGEFEFEATKGSFGRIGWATKLLTVLRTTEILALRLPKMRDEGLIYDTFSGKLVMKSGVIEFEKATLKSTSYTMRASGGIDYALDETKIKVRVEPLKSVDSIVGKVPLLRDVVGAATSLVSVPIRIGGSPNELTFGVEEEDGEEEE